MERMSRWIPLAVVGVLTSLFLGASDAPERQETRKRLEEAVSKTNIFDLPSFQITARVQIIGNQGKSLEGRYQLLWKGPEQWREEITFPAYSEVQIGGKGTVWIQRSTDFIPLRIHELHAALGFGSVAGDIEGRFGSYVQLGLSPNDKIKKTHSRKENGDKLTCVEVENEQKFSSDICVNDSTGTLLRGSPYKDGDFQPIGGKVFPRFLGFVENGQTVAKVNIDDLIVPGQFPTNSFVPVTGVSPEPGCMNPIPFRRIKSVPPKYPQEARQRQIEGVVAVDLWVGTDGIPKIRKVVAGSNAFLEESAVNAIRESRYEPAECDGKPVQVETVRRVTYTLSP